MIYISQVTDTTHDFSNCSSAAILDEVMGTVVWANKHPALTSSMHVNYLIPLPLHATYVCDGWIDSVKIETREKQQRTVRRVTVTAQAEIRSESTGQVLSLCHLS